MNFQFKTDLFEGLNDAQKEAVACTEGPVLVLAGAGSGKTRVLTHRIAHIIQLKLVKPWQILAVTFTNKAAGELKQRAAEITSGGEEVAAGTFHSTMMRVLRREAGALGYPRDFSIFDSDDSNRLVKQIMKDHSEDRFRPRTIHSIVSRLKNDLITPETYDTIAKLPMERVAAGVYPEYQKRLKILGAMDFDDLITLPIKLFREFPVTLNYWSGRWRYLHVDEMQDTNRAQFELLRMLAGPKPNLFAVGDDDQSIYGWRGAQVENIFKFGENFPGAKVFRLEQNYRSTQHILDLAHAVVAKSNRREEKKLWTDKKGGPLPVVQGAPTDIDEAREVVDRIGRATLSGKRAFKDMAILYRTNAQSRLFEDALRAARYPYQLLGGVGFYSRKEIRDAVGYFRLCLNPLDEMSLRRVISEPPRGIGATTLQKLQVFGSEHDLALFEVMEKADQVTGLGTRAVKACREFALQIRTWRKELDQAQPEISEAEIDPDSAISPIDSSEKPVEPKLEKETSEEKVTLEGWAKKVLEESGYIGRLHNENDFEATGRLDNLDSLFNSLAEHAVRNGTLQDYLEQAALASDQDKYDPGADSVRLMTIHAAKGLEFPCVFVTGLEDKTFPLRSPDDADSHDLDEERRLFYVAVTRAHEELVLTYAANRRVWGQFTEMGASPFIEDLPKDGVEWASRKPRSMTMPGLQTARSFQSGATTAVRRPKRKDSAKLPNLGQIYRAPSEDESPEVDRELNTHDDDIPAVRAGDLVKHDKFGHGIVLSVEPYQDSVRVKLEFDGVGKKTLIQKFAKLQPVKDFD
jgi:ATP-dependent DNA helicase UvrD/PcrA